MRNTETGEFELVMGNRQLLSGFFIVALLFGVAFAMGYIVGRNSSPSAKAQAEAAGNSSQAATEQRPPASGARVDAPPAPVSEPPKTDSPAAAPSDAPPAGAQTAAAVEKPAAEPPPPPPAAFSEPGAGNYWQVMAVKQPEAEIVLRSLKEKGFPASLGPGPNNLTRVLVGPYSNRESLGKAKAELENAGFHPILKK